MNATVAFVLVIGMMLAGTTVAVFSGAVEPLPESARVAQELELRDLAISVFVIGAAFVAWRTTMREVR